MKRQLCTNVDDKIITLAKERNIKLSYLFERGWEAINNETGQQQEIKDMKRKIESMAKLLAAVQRTK